MKKTNKAKAKNFLKTLRNGAEGDVGNSAGIAAADLAIGLVGGLVVGSAFKGLLGTVAGVAATAAGHYWNKPMLVPLGVGVATSALLAPDSEIAPTKPTDVANVTARGIDRVKKTLDKVSQSFMGNDPEDTEPKQLPPTKSNPDQGNTEATIERGEDTEVNSGMEQLEQIASGLDRGAVVYEQRQAALQSESPLRTMEYRAEEAPDEPALYGNIEAMELEEIPVEF